MNDKLFVKKFQESHSFTVAQMNSILLDKWKMICQKISRVSQFHSCTDTLHTNNKQIIICEKISRVSQFHSCTDEFHNTR